MANLVLVYGMRLLPADEVSKVDEAPIELKNGNHAGVTMHVLEGSREQIEAQLRLSIDAFFDFIRRDSCQLLPSRLRLCVGARAGVLRVHSEACGWA